MPLEAWLTPLRLLGAGLTVIWWDVSISRAEYCGTCSNDQFIEAVEAARGGLVLVENDQNPNV